VLSPAIMESMAAQGLIALRYVARDTASAAVAYPDDPNGSDGHVAGICDPSGRVFGLMPHPEAFLHPENHPDWTSAGLGEALGLRIIANGVRYAADQP